MSNKLYFLISIVLVFCLTGIVSAQDWVEIEWNNDDGEGDQLWDTATNWDLDRVPMFGDDVILDATYTDDGNGPIIQDGTDAECDWLQMGYNVSPPNEVVLTMTGGTLTVAEWIDLGGYTPGYYRFDLSGGAITVPGRGDGSWEGLYVGYSADSYGVVNMSGGDIDIFGWVWLGWEPNSHGTFNMTGGTVHTSVGFEIGSHLAAEAVLNMIGGTIRADEWLGIGVWHDGGGNGTLNLHGGVIDAQNIYMGPVSHMDIGGGVLTCDTDLTVPNGWLFDPLNDTMSTVFDDTAYTGTLGTMVERGRITAYGVNQGQIITDDVNYPDEVGLRALLKIDYDKTNPGKTTVSAAAVDPNLAYNPIPFDMARGVQPSGFNSISWSAGTNAAQHDVYFGTDETAVANADTFSDEYKGRQLLGNTSYTPDSSIPYVLNTDYFWRIDEVNASDEVEWPGSVWNFTAADHVVVEDFDSYETSDLLDNTWVESTRATVTLQTTVGDANYVRNDQSMEYEYKNNFNPYYSEATRTFSPSMDWTLGGTKALVLWFHGQPANDAERMYLRVTDGGSEATIVYDDPNDLIQEPKDAWHEWNIDLSEVSSAGVDLNNISGITIGFGDGVLAGGTGYVYFEDIRLYPTRCRWDISLPYGDFDGDCTIDSYDMGIMAQTWLMSDGWIVSGLPAYDPDIWFTFDEGAGQVATNDGLMGTDYNGQLGSTSAVDPCDPTWITNDPCSERSRCLEFDGLSHYVAVPELNFNSNTVTITAWIKRDGQKPDSAIVFSREGATPEGICFSGQGDELRYAWNGDSTWSWESGLIVPDGLWTFAALIIEPTKATILMSNGTTYSFVENKTEHIVQTFDGVTTVGRDWDGRNFGGRIDDVRIYNKSLGLGEVLGLAGVDATLYGPLDVVSNIVPRVPDPADDPNYYPENPDIIDFRDYAPFADSWLETLLWP